MNATPPEASSEYSRGFAAAEGDSGRESTQSPGAEGAEGTSRPGTGRGRGPARGFARSAAIRPTVPPGIRTAIFAGGLLGALLLLVAEFTALFEVHVASSDTPLKSVSAGSHNSYALIPIALLVAGLAFGFWRASSRPSLLAIGVLGVVVLLIGLLGDLPDAHASGLVFQAGHYVQASSTPSAGMYMETLGAVVLIITSVCGFLLIGSPVERDAAGA